MLSLRGLADAPYGALEYDAKGRTMWTGQLRGPAHQTAGGVWVISDRDQVQLLLETLMQQPMTGIDTEFEGVPRGRDADSSPVGKARIVTAQFAWPDPELGVHPDLPHVTLAQRVFFPNFGISEDEGWLYELREWFYSADHGKCGSFVFNTELHVFKNHGLIVNGVRGCGVRMSQTWRMGKVWEHGLKPLGEKELHYEVRDFEDVFSKEKLKKDGTPYANGQRLMIPLREAFEDPTSEVYASGLDYASLDPKMSVEGDAHMRVQLDAMKWRTEDGVELSMLTHYDREWNPYQYIIAGMEDAGWAIDTHWFHHQRERAEDDLKNVEIKLNRWAGCTVNWGSNPQKVQLLYEKDEKVVAGNTIQGKGFPVSPVCKSGPTEHWDGTIKKSTDRTALEWVRDHVRRKDDKEGMDNLLRWTKIEKALSAFLRPLPTWVNQWGLVHARIGPEAGTNRLTVRQPPLQTLPQPERDDYSIREGMCAQPEHWTVEVSRYLFQWMSQYGGLVTGVDPETWVEDNLCLIGLDYSQLEMRILAHYLVTLFAKTDPHAHDLANDLAAGDLHANTALRVWGKDPLLAGLTAKDIKGHKDPRVKSFRNKGKILNFSVNYGKTAVGLGSDIRDENGEPIGTPAAQAILDQYFAGYPAILRYHQWAKHYVKTYGYVRTLGGRYRYLEDIFSPIRARRGEAERAALNTPIQGSAADIVSKAMLRSNTLPIPDMRRAGFFDEELYDYGARLVMQIHDELVWRVPWRYRTQAMARIKYHMERPFHPELTGFVTSGLPLPVDGSIGVTYLQTK